jgi:hypothetical protein
MFRPVGGNSTRFTDINPIPSPFASQPSCSSPPSASSPSLSASASASLLGATPTGSGTPGHNPSLSYAHSASSAFAPSTPTTSLEARLACFIANRCGWKEWEAIQSTSALKLRFRQPKPQSGYILFSMMASFAHRFKRCFLKYFPFVKCAVLALWLSLRNTCC